jgi:hypothetical protein
VVERVWILQGMVISRSIRRCCASFVALVGWWVVGGVRVWVGLALRKDLTGLMSWQMIMGLLLGFMPSLMKSTARFASGYFLLALTSSEPSS